MITALTLDIGDAGTAQFNAGITLSNGGNLVYTDNDLQIISGAQDHGLFLAGGNNSNDGANISLGGPSRSTLANVTRFRQDTVESMRIDATGAVTMPLQPAFLAQPASQQANLALNTTHTIVFGTERFDQNADFASNTFTAPVTGKYQLNVNLYLTNLDLDVSYYQFELQTSNRIYYFIQGTTGFDADVNFQQLSLCILADMDASDTAIVRIPVLNAGAAQLDVGTGSSFSGYLVA